MRYGSYSLFGSAISIHLASDRIPSHRVAWRRPRVLQEVCRPVRQPSRALLCRARRRIDRSVDLGSPWSPTHGERGGQIPVHQGTTRDAKDASSSNSLGAQRRTGRALGESQRGRKMDKFTFAAINHLKSKRGVQNVSFESRLGASEVCVCVWTLGAFVSQGTVHEGCRELTFYFPSDSARNCQVGGQKPSVQPS